MFSYFSPEARVRQDHPLRAVRRMRLTLSADSLFIEHRLLH
jgi:hypothetical protein